MGYDNYLLPYSISQILDNSICEPLPSDRIDCTWNLDLGRSQCRIVICPPDERYMR